MKEKKQDYIKEFLCKIEEIFDKRFTLKNTLLEHLTPLACLSRAVV